jgi:glycosyltransferase involved in cell wall biosynthesis
MRIAQLAPLWELVPPRTYGGTELVVHLLTEELVKRGHEVTLFAAKGSETTATLEVSCPMALREMEEKFKVDKTHCSVMAYELKMLAEVFQRASEFDVIHNHVGFQPLAFANFVDTPVVTTLHNALEPQPVRELFYKNAHLPYISISDYQQKLWPDLNYAATIYHGINISNFNPDFNENNKDYLAFLGRLSPEKGPHHAIRVAKALGMKLILAGKIDRVDRIFYEKEIEHLVDGEQITYIGEVDHAQKVDLLRNAAATLCPIEWPEPFGLVLIESMACGTPVFALRDGSIPEVIDHGESGYIADSVEELIEAVRHYRRFSRTRVREIAEKRFSVERMVDDHMRLYERLMEKNRARDTGNGRRSTSKNINPAAARYAHAQTPLPTTRVAGLHIPASGQPLATPLTSPMASEEKRPFVTTGYPAISESVKPSKADRVMSEYYSGYNSSS